MTLRLSVICGVNAETWLLIGSKMMIILNSRPVDCFREFALDTSMMSQLPSIHFHCIEI